MDQLTSKVTSLMNGTSKSIQTTTLPPSAPGQPYVISTQDGEIIYIPLSKSATRLLVTGKETDDAFAVVGTGGSQSDPIGFHYHKEAHDVFLCIQGSMNVWADEKCRTLTAGDLASVPPVSRRCVLSGSWSSFTLGSYPLLSDTGSAYRVHRSNSTRRLGRVLPLPRRALQRPPMAHGRPPQLL